MEYYTIRSTDAGQYTISAFGRSWAVDRHTVSRGKLHPVAVGAELVGKRAYQFTDELRRECLQVDDVPGRAGRFTVVYENQGA